MFIEINTIEIANNKLQMQGSITCNMENKNTPILYVKCNTYNIYADSICEVTSKEPLHKYRFQYTITLNDSLPKYLIYFCYLQNDIEQICIVNSFHSFCPISMKYTHSYYASRSWILTYSENFFTIIPYTLSNHIRCEFYFCKQLAKNKRYKDICIRQLVFLIKYLQHKKIWILYDRIYRADDNGEAFFEYLQSRNNPDIKVYFLLDRHSPDYKRLKKIGKVIPFFTMREKLLFLLCEYKISSHADHYTTYPMGEKNYSFQDLLQNSKFIFLQHGVIKDDLSKWLNYYNRKIFGFVTSAQEEFNSILSLQYEYKSSQIWLTGLPRFDKLYHREQKLITIMPTWRKYLMEEKYTVHGTRKLKANFQYSNFFKAYDSLLSNSFLKNFLNEHGYVLGFMPHPMMEPYIDQFPQYEHVLYFSSRYRYQDIFAWSNIIITDYSSAVFDFALLKKPIIYFHFDFEDFFSGAHTFKQGYFDYSKMAFGEIVTDVEQLIITIVRYINDNCEMLSLYQKRVETFFKYVDHNNCERLYSQIKTIEKNNLIDNTELSIIYFINPSSAQARLPSQQLLPFHYPRHIFHPKNTTISLLNNLIVV